MRCWRSFLGFMLALATAGGGEPPAHHARVIVEPTKTSIYIGTVSMTMQPFVRNGDGYEAAYAAKVFPYFFYNENGRLSVRVSEDMLRSLGRGEPIEFEGRAMSSDGDERHVEAKATPTDATSGRLKVRVFVTRKIQLIFNTSYRFEPAGPQAAAQ